MKNDFFKKQPNLFPTDQTNRIRLFPGIELSYISLKGNSFSIHHKEDGNVMVINYCKQGRVGWKMTNGNYVYLGTGDFSIHTMNLCADSHISLPNDIYEGISIYIDLRKLTNTPPDLLSGTGITGGLLAEKIHKNGPIISIPGNEETESIFRFFFDRTENLRLCYQKIKVIELLLYLYGTENLSNRCLTEYRAEQIELTREIHDYLLNNPDKRITIEQLSKQFLTNPTTLKNLFKSVYGMSVAAHMKEHRIRKAAEMLLKTDLSIAEISLAIGYDSQSKFSAAFKEFFQMTPKEYRKKH